MDDDLITEAIDHLQYADSVLALYEQLFDAYLGILEYLLQDPAIAAILARDADPRLDALLQESATTRRAIAALVTFHRPPGSTLVPRSAGPS